MNGARRLVPLVGALAAALVACAVGQLQSQARRGKFHAAVSALSEAQRKELELVPAVTLANAAWAFGSVDSVRRTSQALLERLPESDGPRRARVSLRFGIVDENFDGQAALFGQACAADARICQHPKEAAEEETRARFVAPGNRLPLSFVGGHPPIGDAPH
ncbi:MAG TPA: hypothetical protein VGK73_28710 [Polyangiaceae bacterium]